MLIIDAYNLLNVQGVLPAHLAGLDLIQLVSLVRSSRHAGDRILLVCDGHLSRLADRVPHHDRDHVRVQFGGVELLFSGHGIEADDVIEALLAHHAGSNTLIMVSSDRRLIRAARKVGARPIGSDAFLRHLAIDHDRNRSTHRPERSRCHTPLNRGSVAFWMHEFGLGEPIDRPPTPEVTIPVAESLPEERIGQDVEPPETEPTIELDDLLVQLIRESRLSIDPVDLDMDRWLREHPPESS